MPLTGSAHENIFYIVKQKHIATNFKRKDKS